LELILWAGALTVLAWIGPENAGRFSLCLFHHLGMPCPGCGLGRSLAHFFRGDFIASLLTHPLGIPAVIILGQRIILLTQEWIKVFTSTPVKS
jgi:hypothetical protein